MILSRSQQIHNQKKLLSRSLIIHMFVAMTDPSRSSFPITMRYRGIRNPRRVQEQQEAKRRQI